MRKTVQVDKNCLLRVICKSDTYFLLNSKKTRFCSFEDLFPKKLDFVALEVPAFGAAEFRSC